MLTILATYYSNAQSPIYSHDIDFWNVSSQFLRNTDDPHVAGIQLPYDSYEIVCAIQKHVVVTWHHFHIYLSTNENFWSQIFRISLNFFEITCCLIFPSSIILTYNANKVTFITFNNVAHGLNYRINWHYLVRWHL